MFTASFMKIGLCVQKLLHDDTRSISFVGWGNCILDTLMGGSVTGVILKPVSEPGYFVAS
jgi:hypothetical protein